MADRSMFLARLGALTQIMFAFVISVFSLFSRQPDFVPRWTVLVVVYSMPGIVALVGLAARRPWLLVAGGLASAVGSILAFSGVTLIFLIPAVLLLAGAAQVAAAGEREPPRAGRPGPLPGAAQPLAAAAIVALLVGSGGAALFLTDAGCWIVHEAPGGNRLEVLPYSTGEMTLSGDATSGGCTDGLIGARGVGLGTVLAGAALGLAALAARRRPRSGLMPGGGGMPPAAVQV